MNATTTLLTADELWDLPRDGRRYELIRGELKFMPPAGFEHGAIEIRVTIPLGHYVMTHGLGEVVGAETGFLIARDPDTVRAPDLAFVRKERILETGIPKKYYPGAPDLAVEIVSPNDTVEEVDDKVQEWLDAGTSLVWVLHPRQRSVRVFQKDHHPQILTVDDQLDGHDVVPGFSVRVGTLFI